MGGSLGLTGQPDQLRQGPGWWENYSQEHGGWSPTETQRLTSVVLAAHIHMFLYLHKCKRVLTHIHTDKSKCITVSRITTSADLFSEPVLS